MPPRRLLPHVMYNLRELGGYPTQDGLVTRFGRFLRSDAPLALTEADIATLTTYGVRHTVDLRSPEVAESRRSSLRGVPGIAYHNISFSDSPLLEVLTFCPRDHYVPLLQAPNRVAEILRCLAACEGGAVLYHCAVGKDRTGMISIFLLLLAGVAEADVKADYQVTFTYIEPLMRRIVPPGRDIALSDTRPEWIQPLLDFIAAQGGIAAYLRSLGLIESELSRLRGRLLDA